MTIGAKDLIRQAFVMARSSGKLEWERMTTAVLKNRLLVLTKNEFQESNYNATNMLDFVSQASDVVRLDKTHFPPVVELIEAKVAGEPSTEQSTKHDRIRPDLWRAVIDYSSGNKYVWDSEQGLARVHTGNDSTGNILPTIAPDQEAKWRQEFASAVEPSLDAIAKKRLTTFLDHSVSPKALPLPLQWQWNEFVKGQILKTLADWFEQRHLAPPERFTVTVRRPTRIVREDDVEDLRALVLSCVKVMTQEELLGLSLPPSAVLRTRRDKL